MSVTDPVTCGFVKIFCYELFTSTKESRELRMEIANTTNVRL